MKKVPKRSLAASTTKTLNFTYLDLTVESGAAVKDVNSGHVYCVFFTSLIRLLKNRPRGAPRGSHTMWGHGLMGDSLG